MYVAIFENENTRKKFSEVANMTLEATHRSADAIVWEDVQNYGGSSQTTLTDNLWAIDSEERPLTRF